MHYQLKAFAVWGVTAAAVTAYLCVRDLSMPPIDPRLVGTWLDDMRPAKVRFEFKEDGSYLVSSVEGTLRHWHDVEIRTRGSWGMRRGAIIVRAEAKEAIVDGKSRPDILNEIGIRTGRQHRIPIKWIDANSWHIDVGARRVFSRVPPR